MDEQEQCQLIIEDIIAQCRANVRRMAASDNSVKLVATSNLLHGTLEALSKQCSMLSMMKEQELDPPDHFPF